jgi:hypothetical protein
LQIGDEYPVASFSHNNQLTATLSEENTILIGGVLLEESNKTIEIFTAFQNKVGSVDITLY